MPQAIRRPVRKPRRGARPASRSRREARRSRSQRRAWVGRPHRQRFSRSRALDLVHERVQRHAVAELDAGRIQPRRPVQVARQRDMRMAGVRRVADPGLRPFQDILDRHAWVGGGGDERGVCAVLQQPPNEIGQQIAMAADRRIDPARRARHVGEQRLIQHLAHAMQALEFVALGATGLLDHARHRQRVVGGELRIEPGPRPQQLPHAGHVGQIGHRLPREHRIVGEPALLRALDLGVPVGALDEPHHQPAAEPMRGVVEPADHRAGALLIRLHGPSRNRPSRPATGRAEPCR